MKQFVIHLSWYEYDKIAVIKAKNKVKALEKLIVEQIKWNKLHDEYDLFNDLPSASVYDDELSERKNIAIYLRAILNKEVSCQCYEINSDTDGIVQWTAKQNYYLEQFKVENEKFKKQVCGLRPDLKSIINKTCSKYNIEAKYYHEKIVEIINNLDKLSKTLAKIKDICNNNDELQGDFNLVDCDKYKLGKHNLANKILQKSVR